VIYYNETHILVFVSLSPCWPPLMLFILRSKSGCKNVFACVHLSLLSRLGRIWRNRRKTNPFLA